MSRKYLKEAENGAPLFGMDGHAVHQAGWPVMLLVLGTLIGCGALLALAVIGAG